jgi:hypothetical protein
MNQFDFYTVKAGASKISDLTRAGIARAKIERRANGFVCYGSRSFRRWYYVATLAYFELTQSAAADALAAEWNLKGVNASVSYHAAD